jgi:hypothetical protein
MKSMKRYAVKPLVVVLAAVVSTGTVAATASAAAGQSSETASVSHDSAWSDPGMNAIAVHSGRALIRHLESARALLETGRNAQARSALLASREFADAIERIMPYWTVVSEIRDAGKRVVEQDTTAFKADLVPIYASLDDLQVFAPQVANRTRGRVRKAEKTAAAGDRKGASQVLTETADDIVQHTVFLPVDYVDEQVHRALRALDGAKPDVVAAKAAVDRALHSVTLVVDDVSGTAG